MTPAFHAFIQERYQKPESLAKPVARPLNRSKAATRTRIAMRKLRNQRRAAGLNGAGQPPKTRRRLLTWNGKTQSVAEWAKELKRRPGTFRQRVTRNWTLERIFA